jgi:cytochrome c553
MLIVFLIIVFMSCFAAVMAGEKAEKPRKKKPAPGKVEQGRIIFNSEGYFRPGSESCASCHVDSGKNNLASAGSNYTEDKLYEKINYCITDKLKGKSRKKSSTIIRALVAYIQSLEAPKETAKYIYICPTGCEGEKSYATPGTCPECGKKLRRIRCP